MDWIIEHAPIALPSKRVEFALGFIIVLALAYWAGHDGRPRHRR